MKIRPLISLLALLLLLACSPAVPTPTPVPMVDIGAIQTQAALNIFATQTASVPTAPPRATNTPPASTFARWKSSDAIAQFQKAGLDVGAFVPMAKEDYGLAPLTATEGTHFFIAALGQGGGGRIMSFASAADLARVKAYYDNLGKQSAAFFSWVFVRDNILVQINGDLPEAEARKYEVALGQLGR